MKWLLYHLACHWRKRNQIQSYKFVLESARFIQTSPSDIDDMLSINGSQCPTEIYGGENIDYKCFSDGWGILLHHFWCCICFWTHIFIKIPQYSLYQNFLRKIQNFDKSDRCLESRCDQYKFFWMLIFGILPQKELYIEEIPKKKDIINFPPLFFYNVWKFAEKVT